MQFHTIDLEVVSSGRSGTRSVIDSMFSGIVTLPDEAVTPRKAVIRRALALWLDIHRAFLSDANTQTTNNLLHSPSSRRVIHGLLDLISLEGIYPCLSPGVGIPIERRVKSVLQGGVVTQPVTEAQEGKELLTEIVDGLYPVVKEAGNGLGLALRERTLVDVIAGVGQLAFEPSQTDQQGQRRHVIVFEVLLGQYVFLPKNAASTDSSTIVSSDTQPHAAIMLNVLSESRCRPFSQSSLLCCGPRGLIGFKPL